MFGRRGGRFGLAAAAVLAAVGLKELFAPTFATEAPFLLLFAPVSVAAWLGGTRPALMTTALAAASAWYLFLPPAWSLATSVDNLLRLAVFVGECATISLLSVSLQRARRQAEQSEERLATTLRSIGDAVIATDEHGRVVFANPVAERLTGWPMVEAHGQPVTRVFVIRNEHTGRTVESPVERVLRAGVTVGLANHTALVARDGTTRSIEDSGAPIRDARGRICGVVLVFRDVTAREREQDRRAFLAEASTAFLESLDVARTLARVAELAVPRLADYCSIYLADGDTLRPVATAHVDPARQAALRGLRERYPPRPDRETALFEVLRSGRSRLIPEVTDELLAANAHDAAHLEQLRALGVRSAVLVPLAARAQSLGVLALARTTAGRPLEKADLALAEELARRAALAVDNARLYARAQQAIALRDEFLSIASHELRTPLTPLLLQVESVERALASTAPDPGRLAARLHQAARQGRRLARLVEGLLDVSRITAGRLVLAPEEMELGELVSEVVARHAEEAQRAGSRLVLEAPRPVHGRWDRLRLEQILGNLLSNAIKYGEGRPVEVRLSGDDENAELIVRDQGIGIAPEDLARIFDRFERGVSARHYGGLGLGLYIARQIAEAHGGAISVESQPGAGATFRVILPRFTRETPPPPAPFAPEPAAQRTAH